jgi:hypothetical protein
VGNESKFCWNCKKDLRPEDREVIAGGVWQKPKDVFAQRLDVGDEGQLLKSGLNVQTGQLAILLDGGAIKGKLEPGVHKLDGLLRRFNWFGNAPPRTLIVLDDGDVVLPLRIEGLRTANEVPVELYSEVVIHFDEKREEEFARNCFKDSDKLLYGDILARFAGETRYAAENVCNTSQIEDLIKDPERRLRLEDELQRVLDVGLRRCGLSLIRVASVEFIGAEYEELREKMGQIEINRQKIEFDQRLRELASTDKMNQFKTEHDLDQYIQQLAHEKDVSAVDRAHEIEVLKQAHRHEITATEARHAIELEMIRVDADIGQKTKWDEFERDKTVKDAQAKAAARGATFEQEKAETDQALKWRAEKDRLSREDLAERARTVEGKSARTLMALIEDPDKRRDILEFERLEAQKGRSEIGALALAAEHSPAAAEALRDMARDRRQDLEREMQERKKLSDENSAQIERVLKAFLEAQAEFAKHSGPPPNIVNRC